MRVTVTCFFLSVIASALTAAAVTAASVQTGKDCLKIWAQELGEDGRIVPQQVEMLEVDGINRKGKLRVEGTGETQEFNMLPAGTVIYRGGYTDLRYVPVGARMVAFVRPEDGTKAIRIIQLVDDLAVQSRMKQMFRLEKVNADSLVVSLASMPAEKLTIVVDDETAVWSGLKKVSASGLKAGQELAVNFRPSTNGAARTGVEIWADTASVVQVAEQTRTNYVRYLTLRGLPGEVGVTTRDTFEVSLFTGADRSLRSQFKEGSRIHVAAADERLRTYGQEVDRVAAQVRKVETSLNGRGEEIVKLTCHARVMLEGFRPGRNVRAWAEGWPVHGLPREERLFPWDQFNLPDIENLPKEPMLSLPFALPIPPK